MIFIIIIIIIMLEFKFWINTILKICKLNNNCDLNTTNNNLCARPWLNLQKHFWLFTSLLMRKYFDDHYFFQFIADCLHTFSKARMLAKNKQNNSNNNNNSNNTNCFLECMLYLKKKEKKKYKFTASDTHGHHSL